jgi:hypothetical protein
MPAIRSHRLPRSLRGSLPERSTVRLALSGFLSKFATCVDAPSDARRIFGSVQRVVRADMCAAFDAAHMPRARMGVRGSGPIHNHVLEAPVAKLVFLIPSR